MVYQQISAQLNFVSTKSLILLLFLFLGLILNPLTASAVVVDELFEVEMPILDESKAIRRAALDDGLIEVLIRVSGDSNILEKIKAPASGSYVKQFKYMKTEGAKAGDTSQVNQQHLWVQYNGTKILNFLREKAIPIWGVHRSQVVIWLAVRDGSHRYILKQSDSSLIKSKTDMAFARRGIPAIWPENDEIDRDIVRFADIRAGFTDPLKQASIRYSSGPVIVANMAWTDSVWESEWSIVNIDGARKWSLRGADYKTLIARAIDLTADAMGQKFAVLEALDVSQQKQVMAEIGQVKTVEDFRRIEKYLSSLSAVQSVQLSQIESERVLFGLTLRTKVDDLLNLIQSGSTMALLTEEASDEVTTAVDANELVNTADMKPVSSMIKADYRFILR